MQYEQILYDKQGRIARITANRPRYRNAQSRLLLEEMDAAFAEAADDPEVRVIILAGAGNTSPPGMTSERRRSWRTRRRVHI